MFMRFVFRALLCMSAGSLIWLAAAQEKKAAPKPPEKVVFAAKTGNVTYDHKKHLDREKGKCETCHPKLFPQSKAPINFKAAMHKTAEAAKSSCAACHVEGGTAFVTKGNCNKCHVKAAAAPKA